MPNSRTQLTGEQLAERVTAGEQVAALMEHPGWAYFVRACETEERAIQRHLMQQAATDVAADYATKVGRMRGLRDALAQGPALVKNGRNAESSLRQRELRSVESG